MISILVVMALVSSLFAQEKTKQREVGLAFTNFDNFGITYKVGNEKALWRYNVLFLSGNLQKENLENSNPTYSRLGFGLKIGKEFRKPIIENLEFRYGLDISFDYHQSKQESEYPESGNLNSSIKSINYEPGINLVVGVNYVIKEHLVIGAEIMPYFSYLFGTSEQKSYNTGSEETITTDFSNISYGFSNSSAMLSLAYRF